MDDGEAAAPALEALRSLQAPLIAAHVEHQRLMVESHVAFLRAVSAPYEGLAPLADPREEAPGADAGVGFDREGTRAFWRGVTGMPSGWAGEDLLFALIDTFVGRVTSRASRRFPRCARGARSTSPNHQVAVETILAALVLGRIGGTKARFREWVPENPTQIGGRRVILLPLYEQCQEKTFDIYLGLTGIKPDRFQLTDRLRRVIGELLNLAQFLPHSKDVAKIIRFIPLLCGNRQEISTMPNSITSRQ